MISLISIIVALIVIGFGLWLVEQLPLDATVKKIIVGVAIFLVVIWVLQSLGFLGNIGIR